MNAKRIEVGAVLDGRFELVRPLGHGATGVVWLARDRLVLSGMVALKILHPHLVADSRAVDRLKQEAELLSRLDHPNIARARALAFDGELYFLATEFVDGDDLDDVLRDAAEDSGLSLPTQRAIIDDVGSALAFAHSRGVLHRDIKPPNIVIEKRLDRVFAKILDFGLAKLVEANPGDGTTRGRQTGSLFYLSPEQARGESATAKSDVFSMAVLIFELLTQHRAFLVDFSGRPARIGEEPIGSDPWNAPTRALERIVSGPRPSVRAVAPELPPEIDRILDRALAVDPNTRPTAEGLRNDLLAALPSPHELSGVTRVSPRVDDPTDSMVEASGSGPADTVVQRSPTRTEIGEPRGPSPDTQEPTWSGDTTDAESGSRTEPEVVPTRPDRGPEKEVSPPQRPRALPGPSAPPRAKQTRVQGYLVWLGLGVLALLGLSFAHILSSGDDHPVSAESIPIASPQAVAAEVQPEPAEEGEKVSSPSPSDRAKRPTRLATPPKSVAPSPPKPKAPISAPRVSKLAELRRLARSEPTDPHRLKALADQIIQDSVIVVSDERRETIHRMVASSMLALDLSGLEAAADALEAERTRR